MNRNLPPAVADNASVPRLWTWLGTASLVILMIVYRPYLGIAHDARVYIGQAMAALDPGGVGRDLMFVQDRQSGFSIYPLLVKALVAAVGPATAALGLTLAGLGLWLAGATALASRLARGRLMWAVLVCIVVLAPGYGGLGVFGYGEPFATPRPFAEAAVMAGLAALMPGRRWPAIALFAVAAVLHPIMALPGAAAAFVLLVWEDRRWLWAGAAALVVAGAAAALRLPVADRLLTPIDPAWLQLLIDRNTYLFASHWVVGDFSRPAVQLVTLAIAAAYVPRRAQVLFAAGAAAGLGGLALAWLLGDLVPSVLVAQMQLWRGLWLIALMGNAALALAAAGLWRDGGGARLALAALALAWISIHSPAPALGFAALALGLHMLARRGRLSAIGPRAQTGAATAVAVVAVIGAVRIGLALADYLIVGAQAGAPVGWVHALGTDLPRLTVAAAAIAVAAARARSVGPSIAATAGIILAGAALFAVAVWDARPGYRRALDARQGRAEMTALLAAAPGEILWVGGDTESWLLADRPNWSSDIQGAGLVFSRPLALAWDARIRTLVDLGLARPQSRLPFSTVSQGAPVQPGRAGIAALCARPDAPAAVVIPGRPPAGLVAEPWRPGQPRFYGYDTAGGYGWRRVGVFSVIPCRPAVSAPRP